MLPQSSARRRMEAEHEIHHESESFCTGHTADTHTPLIWRFPTIGSLYESLLPVLRVALPHQHNAHTQPSCVWHYMWHKLLRVVPDEIRGRERRPATGLVSSPCCTGTAVRYGCIYRTVVLLVANVHRSARPSFSYRTAGAIPVTVGFYGGVFDGIVSF